MDELLQEFIAETRETLAALASEIVAWEADPADRARLDAIFRFVHTVKGSCGFLDLPRLAKLSHEAENVLAAVRDGRRQPDGRLVDAVLAIVDRIGALTEALDAGTEVEGTDDVLIAALSERAAPADAPVPQPTAPAAKTAAPRTASRSVRLPVDLLDRMMNGMSEMVLARNELARKLRDGVADPASEAALERLSLTVADMRDTVSRTRMQAIEALFAALPRMVRDTAGQLGKPVALTIEGGDVEIDREMIEAMRDPLMHVIRNAIDHGIEPPERRIAAGKPVVGRLTVAARQSGNTIVVEVSDDGAGIDTARLVAKHAAANGRDPREYAGWNDRARLDLIFEAGLSSRDDVTEISGRGVGMDVVRANVEQVGGRIDLRNDPGKGLAVVLQAPLTLSILPTIVLGTGGQRFAIARQSVEEIIAGDCASVRIDRLGDGRVVGIRGERMPLVDLGATLGLADDGDVPAMLAVVSVPGGAYAIAVERVFDMEELVVKPAAPPIMACGLFAGQTLPDTGVPMLVLDPGGIASASGITFTRAMPVEPEPSTAIEDGVEMLIVRDLDGATRAIPLAAVDRIEDVVSSRVAFVGGKLRLTDPDGVIDLIGCCPLPDSGLTVVRLQAGGREVAYAVAEPIEIAPLSNDMLPVDAGGTLAGITMRDGQPIEVLDPAALTGGKRADAAERPICVIAGEAQQWLAGFLTPVLEQAGYHVAIEPPVDAGGVTILAMENDAVDIPAGGQLVRLSEQPGRAAPFGYDPAGVLAALARVAR